MRPTILCIISLLLINFSSAQEFVKPVKVSWHEWTDSLAFFKGPRPHVVGEGPLTDSLAFAFNGKIFFESEEGYFLINSTADYYYWFTQTYPDLFKKDVAEYQMFYHLSDAWNMTLFVQVNYKKKILPLKFNFILDTDTPPSYQNKIKDERVSQRDLMTNEEFVNNSSRTQKGKEFTDIKTSRKVKKKAQ